MNKNKYLIFKIEQSHCDSYDLGIDYDCSLFDGVTIELIDKESNLKRNMNNE